MDHTLACDEQLRRDQQLLHEQLSEQNRDLREAHIKSFHEMEELKRFQGSTFDEFWRRRLIEDRDAILELTARRCAKTDPHGPDCSENHGDSTAAVY